MNFLYKLVELLTPKALIGGLEVSDVAIRFLELGSGNKIVRQESIPLEAGVMRNGRVKDPARFLAALLEMKAKIEPRPRHEVQVILSITSSNVYSQTIFLPEAAQDSLAEAAELNIQMSSPVRLDSAYHDWHIIRRKERGQTAKIELLTAVIGRDVINELVDAFRKSGFVVIAIDFAALSMVRILRALKTNLGQSEPYAVLAISPDGLDFFVTRAGELYFDYFHSWDSLKGMSDTISVKFFHELIENEIVRLINFYSSRYEVSIKNLVVVAPGLFEEIKVIMQARLSDLKVQSLEVEGFEHVPTHWAVAIGAALRARTPRYEDVELSLSSLSTKGEYSIIQLAAFVKLWRNVVWTTMIFLVGLFTAVLFFLVRYQADVGVELRSQLDSTVDVTKLQNLQKTAQEANTLIEYTDQVSNVFVSWTPFLRRMQALVPADISLERFGISRLGAASVAGTSISREAALAYRDILTSENGLTDVVLPFAMLLGSPGADIHFVISFKVPDIKKFDKY